MWAQCLHVDSQRYMRLTERYETRGRALLHVCARRATGGSLADRRGAIPRRGRRRAQAQRGGRAGARTSAAVRYRSRLSCGAYTSAVLWPCRLGETPPGIASMFANSSPLLRGLAPPCSGGAGISSSCPVWYWRERRLETGTTDMRAGSVYTASRARVASGARGMPVNAGRMLASDAPLKL